jgi:ribonuclease P/MRP protein subunit POP1
MTTAELCELRSKNQLVPGIASSFEKDLQPVPLLLVQRPGSQTPELKRLGLGSGWDVIVPAGYGISVWLSLIRCGAKPGGWRETETVASEMGLEVFLPDTICGVKENSRQLKMQRDEYFRRPPNKRTNYKKMGISSPFACPFDQLVKEWSGVENFHILRSRSMLETIDRALRSKNSLKGLESPVNALIPINVTMESRGTPGDFGIICLPTKRDIKSSLVQKYNKERGPIAMEPLMKDETEKERKSVRHDHKKLLKRLRNRRVRAKRKLQATASRLVKIQKSSAEKVIEEQNKKMCELWLPKQPATVRHQCSRQVFGYLSKSRFTFSEGKICGVGYVTRDGLSKLLEVFQKFKGLQPFVLTRATSSHCYHSATISVRMNV